MEMRHARRAASAAGMLVVAGAAWGGPITVQLVDPNTQQHSGWQVTIFDDTVMSVTTVSVDSINNKVVIEKNAEFKELDIFGNPAAMTLLFQQVLPDAQTMTNLAITSESVKNSTGFNWIDFEMIVIDSGQVMWNPAASAGFTISPFTQSEFKNNDLIFRAFGGVVADGATWTPGVGGGELVAQIDLAASNPVSFSLKELPSVPSPSSLALLSLAGVVAIPRRR